MSRPFIPVPNTASVEMIYSFTTETCENVFHVSKGSPFSAADLAALRAVVDTWDSSNYITKRAPATILTRIRTKALDTASSPIEDYALPTPRGGSSSGTQMPNNVAYCVKLSTGLAGRSYRGRWYAMGITSAQVADTTHLTSAASAALVASLNALRTSLATAGYTLCVVSYRHLGVWRTTGVATPATGFVAVDLALDSMRRRLAGRGRP